VLKHFLGNDPGKAISLAGVFLLMAAGATLLMKTTKPDPDAVIMTGGGH
jgi:hypothetical protein